MTPPALNVGRRNGVKVGRFVWLYEIECRCCGTAIVRPRLIQIFDKIRAKRGHPITPTSWCRCTKKNREIYAAKGLDANTTSPHLIGRGSGIRDFGGYAFDIPVAFNPESFESWFFNELDVVGVGFGPDFTHVDIKPRPGTKHRSWKYVDGKPEVLSVIAA